MGENKIWTPSEMGKKGGKASAEARLKGKKKEEVSAAMSALVKKRWEKRVSKLEGKISEKAKEINAGAPISGEFMADCLNLSVEKSSGPGQA